MLVIKPEECIDCGVCVAECPAKAIIPDTEPGAEKWVEINAYYSNQWPNIRKKKPAPANADIPDKFEQYFNPNPPEDT
jgi:ferredoxin